MKCANVAFSAMPGVCEWDAENWNSVWFRYCHHFCTMILVSFTVFPLWRNFSILQRVEEACPQTPCVPTETLLTYLPLAKSWLPTIISETYRIYWRKFTDTFVVLRQYDASKGKIHKHLPWLGLLIIALDKNHDLSLTPKLYRMNSRNFKDV